MSAKVFLNPADIINMNEKTLNQMARNMVGDNKGPNMFFVTNAKGDSITATTDFAVAYGHWKMLAQSSPRRECCLEDRKYGVLASISPDEDGKLVLHDETDSPAWKVQKVS